MDVIRVTRIVSGGQTGADRAALDAARRLGLEHAGWCPAGGWAEDLPDPPGLLAAYPRLTETPDADPATRTRWNVRDSDATLVLVLEEPFGSGTGLTLRTAEVLGRPHLLARADDVASVRSWLQGLESIVLNVGGPRESEQPGLYAAARATLLTVLADVAGGPRRPRQDSNLRPTD